MTRQAYVGEFVESADLMRSPPITVTISDIVPPNTEKSADGQLIERPIIAFEKTHKRFILGKTNERLIKAQLGSKPADWVGKQITLGVRYLKKAFDETNIPTIRVVLPSDVPMPFGCRKYYGAEQPYEIEEQA